MRKILVITSLLFVLSLVSCQNDDNSIMPDVNYNPTVNPANFSFIIDNPYFPLTPGKIYTYSGAEDIIITVSTETKIVAGVTCIVVRDLVAENGVTVEDTYDWYAQDNEGNVWYFGEKVSNYENGVFVDSEGSFESGVDGAKPGIIMLASPVIEMPYRQEYYFNVAEDWGKVVAKGLTITTPFGTFNNCIKTEDWNALEPEVAHEYKYYAPGIGMVKEEIAGSSEVVELVSVQ